MTTVQIERLESARKSATELMESLKKLKAELEARKQQKPEGKDTNQ